jgi:malate/lactate dehydrogenase
VTLVAYKGKPYLIGAKALYRFLRQVLFVPVASIHKYTIGVHSTAVFPRSKKYSRVIAAASNDYKS